MRSVANSQFYCSGAVYCGHVFKVAVYMKNRGLNATQQYSTKQQI